jgi:hypothetical protein
MKNSENLISHGLKPARNDKMKGFLAAYLKVRPFQALAFEFFTKLFSRRGICFFDFFSGLLKPFPDTKRPMRWLLTSYLVICVPCP